MQSLQEDIGSLINQTKTDIVVSSDCGKYSDYWKEFKVPMVGDMVELDYRPFVVVARHWVRSSNYPMSVRLVVKAVDGEIG